MRDKSSTPDDFANRFDSALARLQVAVLDACEREAQWPAKIAAAIHAALGFAAADPAAARTLTVDALAQGGYGVRRRQRAIEHYAELLGAGAPEDPRRPAIAEEIAVSAIASILTERVYAGAERELPTLAPQLVEFVLIPYLGTEEAKAHARRYRP